MAIPSQQIGWSQKSKLLWQISKQLEYLTCIGAGGCNTTTTTTTFSGTNYNVAGCERMEYHVITYTGEGVLSESTIVNNDTPECWFIIDQTTNPADVGTVTYVWPTLGDCTPCIDSHTTTTTTTAIPLILVETGYYGNCQPCLIGCPSIGNSLWLEQSCVDVVSIGCHGYLDSSGTTNAPGGYYDRWDGIPGLVYIDINGLVLNIDVCPQP